MIWQKVFGKIRNLSSEIQNESKSFKKLTENYNLHRKKVDQADENLETLCDLMKKADENVKKIEKQLSEVALERNVLQNEKDTATKAKNAFKCHISFL